MQPLQGVTDFQRRRALAVPATDVEESPEVLAALAEEQRITEELPEIQARAAVIHGLKRNLDNRKADLQRQLAEIDGGRADLAIRILVDHELSDAADAATQAKAVALRRQISLIDVLLKSDYLEVAKRSHANAIDESSARIAAAQQEVVYARQRARIRLSSV